MLKMTETIVTFPDDGKRGGGGASHFAGAATNAAWHPELSINKRGVREESVDHVRSFVLAILTRLVLPDRKVLGRLRSR